MDGDADRGQTREAHGTEMPTAFVETTPADRAGWEEALAEPAAAGGGEAGAGRDAGVAAVVPEYEEDHPIGPASGQEDLSIADLRPEVEGETTAEQARRQGTAE